MENQNPHHRKETEFHGDFRAFVDSADPFIDSDEWIAAEVRQLFRAHRANDAKAKEVALFYFVDFLTKTLGNHLRKSDPAWANSSAIVDSHRWFDGLNAAPDYPAP